MSYERALRIVRDHYRLARPATDAELAAEVANIARRRERRLGLDDSQERLAARLAPYMKTIKS